MADLVFLPDQVGTGIKTRAIQSLAAGKPVLASAIAFEGIPVIDGLNASVGAGNADFVRRFDELCSNAGAARCDGPRSTCVRP